VFDKNVMPCKRMVLPQQNNCTDCGCFLLAYIEVCARLCYGCLLMHALCAMC
jgi:Ulp1 family protease